MAGNSAWMENHICSHGAQNISANGPWGTAGLFLACLSFTPHPSPLTLYSVPAAARLYTQNTEPKGGELYKYSN